ncbi:MAG: hypothetical protein QG577_2419 [Thermodesulfobacteriota bacterium]|nr:hypothetical protein [Thermodesulfobacteriota bacterium]
MMAAPAEQAVIAARQVLRWAQIAEPVAEPEKVVPESLSVARPVGVAVAERPAAAVQPAPVLCRSVQVKAQAEEPELEQWSAEKILLKSRQC